MRELTIVIGSKELSARSWWQANCSGPILIANPAFSDLRPSCQLSIWEQDKWRETAFVGTEDVTQAPHIWIAAVLKLLQKLPEVSTVVFPPLAPSPTLYNTFFAAIEVMQPNRIIIPAGVDWAHGAHWTVGPEEVEMEPAPPAMVDQAKRRSQWMSYLSSGKTHEIDLSQVRRQGTRIGIGDRVDTAAIAAPIHPESLIYRQGSVLFVVSSAPLDDQAVNLLLNITHTEKIVLAAPEDYVGVVCSLAYESGEDFALGIVTHLDLSSRVITVQSPAIPPAPVRCLKLGLKRTNLEGQGLITVRPWSI